jgi:hypothetical protein
MGLIHNMLKTLATMMTRIISSSLRNAMPRVLTEQTGLLCSSWAEHHLRRQPTNLS